MHPVQRGLAPALWREGLPFQFMGKENSRHKQKEFPSRLESFQTLRAQIVLTRNSDLSGLTHGQHYAQRPTASSSQQAYAVSPTTDPFYTDRPRLTRVSDFPKVTWLRWNPRPPNTVPCVLSFCAVLGLESHRPGFQGEALSHQIQTHLVHSWCLIKTGARVPC